ncbi:hypothetical protein [Kurthia gibsonii]|uniref:hypothetical protein n=1 Tax=Kurthia gibsonii TaxID=33946 RepID=UPI002DB8E9C8|nr:hypothetical protein [Kurthia gibsonii]MEB7772103.1 hypothetical protein [Kurthia gibsonii]
MNKFKKMVTLLALFIAIFALGNLIASASTTELSKEQKLKYYKQYEEIVSEINSGNPNSSLELGPFADFNSEDFIKPSEFKKYAIERSNIEFNIVSDSNTSITPFSIKTVKSNGASVAVTINGFFNTQYSDVHKRQMFSGINSITTKTSKGKWTKSTSSGYSARLLDGGRTYEITVSGTITINNLSSSHNIVVEFYCNANGSVS